jgi:hypothetical protein
LRRVLLLRVPDRRALPAWLAHPLRWQRVPVPWAAVARGALGAGPLLAAAVAVGRPEYGVLAGLGAMLAGVNDRPGTRRTGTVHIGLPALAGALGFLIGGTATAVTGTGWWALPVLFAVGVVSGTVSVIGPVSSTAGVQLLVATIISMGVPLPLAAWLKAVCFLAGAGWLLLLRLALRPPRPLGTGGALGGERAVLAAVFEALAAALAAVGGPNAVPARRRLTAALDRADETMRLHRLFRRRASSEELLLVERFAAATALCEAAVALLWEAHPLPDRVTDGPRRLATAIRSGSAPGPLPAPEGSTAARAAFDRALLDAAVAFGHDGPGHDGPGRKDPAGEAPDRGGSAARLRAIGGRDGVRRARRHAFGAAGRQYGVRVGMCVTASAALALALRAEHWYWLPATAAFLVKPDMGPLFSRVVNRFFGTAVGVLVFAAVTALVAGGTWWAPVVATAAGAAVPVAVRHFALQTAVITVLVLTFVSVAGDTQAAGPRLIDTGIACAIVSLVGHLPPLVDPAARVGHRLSTALRRTEAYLDHVLAVPPGKAAAERRALRRSAYRALGEARAAAETAAAELPAQRGPAVHWVPVVAAAERIVDAATACAIRMEHGAPRPAAAEARQVTGALVAVAEGLEGREGGGGPLADLVTSSECATLADVVTELRRIREVTA